jgi:hypothetical protein
MLRDEVLSADESRCSRDLIGRWVACSKWVDYASRPVIDMIEQPGRLTGE